MFLYSAICLFIFHLPCTLLTLCFHYFVVFGFVLTTKDKTVCASNSNVEKPVASGVDSGQGKRLSTLFNYIVITVFYSPSLEAP